MADAVAIMEVIDNLPTDSGWDETKVALYLDKPLSVKRTLLAFWTSRAAQSANYVNISESGSSRDLATIHKNAVAMVDYWQKAAEVEETPTDQNGETVGRIMFHKATRV